MQGKVKLSKRQLKEDKFTTFVLSSKERVRESWQVYTVGIVAVILVIIAVVYFTNSQSLRSQEAEIQLAQAEQDFQIGNELVAVTSLGKMVEEYEGTPAAERGTFLLGRINFKLRNYPESKRFYERYVAKYGDNPLRLSAAMAGLAAILENQASHKEAALKYDEAVRAYPDGPQVGDYQLGALRTYLAAGDMESARAKIDAIKIDFENTPVGDRAVLLYTEKGTQATP